MSSLFATFFSLVSFRTRAVLRRRFSHFVINSQFPKRTHRVVCASSAQIGSCGFAVAMVPGWRHSLQDTVIAWHRRALAWYWTRKSRRRRLELKYPSGDCGNQRRSVSKKVVFQLTCQNTGCRLL